VSTVNTDNLELIERYEVHSKWQVNNGNQYNLRANIEIYDSYDSMYYIVNEPFSYDIQNRIREIISKLERYIEYNNSYIEDPVRYLLNLYNKMYKGSDNYEELREAFKYYVIKERVSYGILSFPLSDINVEDISCIGPENRIKVWHKKYNYKGWLSTNIMFNQEELDRTIRKLAYRTGKSISILRPTLESVLPEGFRLTATWRKEISPLGSSFTIRKFRSEPYTMTELINYGTIDTFTAAYLWMMTELKKFIVIIGPSSTGKTTLVNALAYLVPPNSKIVTIEDIRELNLSYHNNWKPLTTRPLHNDDTINIFDLVKLSLRERADLLILGESRGEEARLICQAAATGHGCLTTFHAETISGLLARLRSYPINVDDSMLLLIDTVVIMQRENNRTRRIYKVAENHNLKWETISKYIGNGKWIHYSDNIKNICGSNDNINNIHMLMHELDKRRKFLHYLVKLKILSPLEFSYRIKMFYAGVYKYENGRWILKA